MYLRTGGGADWQEGAAQNWHPVRAKDPVRLEAIRPDNSDHPAFLRKHAQAIYNVLGA